MFQNKKNIAERIKGVKSVSKTKFIVILILSIIGAALIGGGVWVARFVRRVENPWPSQAPKTFDVKTQDPNVTNDPNVTPGPTPTPKGDGEDIVWGKDVINILFIGYDKDSSREDTWSVFRTDTLILLTVYYNENRVVMTSIPRDSYVPIADTFSYKDKINSVPYYAQRQKIDVYGAICSTVCRLFGGVPVDYYMAIDMDLFSEVIDLIGGVEYDVDVDVRFEGESQIRIKKGKQVLNGAQALDYVRFRGTPLADIDRVNRQRRFLTATFSQLKSLDNITKLPEIYKAVMNKLNTNLTYEQVANLLSFAAGKLQPDAISGTTLPGKFLNINGISYWGIDQNKRVHYIYDMFGITVLPDPQD